MKITLTLFAAILLAPLVVSHAADAFIVEDGKPRAEIVISAKPSRMQRVAAHEFRMQIEKISGARLSIVTAPSGNAVKIFIGASLQNPVTADGLKDGAYRIATGADWMALVGDDTEFTPMEPFAKNNGDIPRAQAEWEKIVGAPYGMPARGLYKNRLRLPGDTGKPDSATTEPKETLDIWGLDERGSFNAVCGYLRKLGARWYLPGELGEVLPSMKTIPLPQIDETVQPDFPLRQFNFRFSTAGPETSMWVMRLGLRNDERLQIAHGISTMTNHQGVFDAHPDWFAIYGGKTDFKPGDSKCQVCYSNDELFDETVRWARTLLDTYKLETVSIMPPDGYTAICQCEKCKGKDSPERNERGLLSDHVWGFVNRVAKEIAKSHPRAKVLNCAYGVYTLPPLNIEKLESNVLVCIVGGRRPINKGGVKGEGESAPDALRAAWLKKTDNPLLNFENYPFTDRGWYLPSFAAHAIGDSVSATKGVSAGEDIWLSAARDFSTKGIGFNHFLVYFTARMYWGGKDADVDAMLREYCRLFYGPAEQEMLAFFTHCEANWSVMEEDKAKADEALALFDKVKAKADVASVYGNRVSLIDDYLKGLRMKTEQLGQKRGPVPKVRLVGDAHDIVVDGKFDEEYWQKCPVAATGKFRELQTGRTPTFGTSFKAGWKGSNLYFAIRCDEHPGEKPVSASTRDDDQAIWHGDVIEIELATETHAYYQIAISPAGHIVDLDRGAGKSFGWDSKAEVATHIADDHWTVEIRFPVTTDENDPLNQVIGRHPTQSLPWHINLCRQRIRKDGQELSAFSPTGTNGFHMPMKFAHLYDGKSHQFEADSNVTDFAIGFQNATKDRKAAGFLALAELEEITDLQKAASLEQAALLDKANAEAIIERIPVEAVKKTAHMQRLLAQGKASEVISQFAKEDLTQWPFWKCGDGYQLRGRAYYITKDGAKAEADLTQALSWVNEPRTRDSLLLAIAQNRERNLGDDDGALEAFIAVVADRERIGSADEYCALQSIARIQTRRGQYDEALRTLNRANPDKLQGTWRENILKSIEVVNEAKREGAK
jgi:tetratricopeptide (TPR) repeat protein